MRSGQAGPHDLGPTFGAIVWFVCFFGPSVVGIRSVLAPTLIQEGESVNHSLRFTQRQDLQRYRNGLEVHVHSVRRLSHPVGTEQNHEPL